MIKQTITWTALPRRSDGPRQAGTELRLSVFVAPRLWNDDPTVTVMPLGSFPDWLDWPAVVAAASFTVEFEGGPTLPATVESAAPRSDLWQALFNATKPVKPFVFEDLSGVKIDSFAAATIHDTIRGVWQRAAIDPSYGDGVDLPGRATLANDPDLADIAREVRPRPPWQPPPTDRGPVRVGGPAPPDEPPGPGDGGDGGPGGSPPGCTGCLLWPFELLRRLLRRLGLSVVALPFAAMPLPREEKGKGDAPPPAAAEPLHREEAAAPEGPRPSVRAASAKKEAFDKLHAYVQPYGAVSAPLPTQTQVEDQFDFHQMVSSLGDYPALMRQLGLVVDLTATLPATLPAATGRVRVVPTASLAIASSNVTPRTRYELDVERFLARPRSGSDLSHGLLRLNDNSRFRVLQIDVAGSGVKLQNTATNLHGMEQLGEWPVNAPQDAGLPALQTAGISVVRPAQVPELSRRFAQGFALNAFLASVDGSPTSAFKGEGPPPAPSDELAADDLVRGYRLDIWDDKSGQWHSLCRRVGDYAFLEGPGGTLSLVDLEDEGFTQMASTESLVPVPERKLRVHESLFTWDGWSLVAPRPGKTILVDDTQTGHVVNAARTQFKLETAFRAKPGSLPRLRFGWTYRVRARAVDLAGNSAFGPDDAAFADTQPDVTPEFRFGRYEPIAPPSLTLRALPVEGESLERLVVRSTIHESPATIAGQSTERHVVPPKTSQLMAERHEIFDGAPGMRKDQAAYDLASREAGSLIERMNTTTGTLELIPGTVKEEDAAQKRVYWLQTGAQFVVAFLPDNAGRGALFLGLPGMATPETIADDVNRIAFSGAWPDLRPFRLRLRGLAAAAAPAPPAWNAADRVLTVEVAQGETLAVRYSSFFHQADLEKAGVWEWIKEANPADLLAREKQATDGRAWLLLPYRDLVLVHAVQQPLAIPVASQLTPTKLLGGTDVTFGVSNVPPTDRIEVDAKSTGKVDLRASWADPFDDLRKPSFDSTTDVVRQEMHVAELVVHDPANDQLAVAGVKHALGDTKYHRVTYTPIATTRYREYFPPAVLANPQDLIRPTPAEVGTPPADGARLAVDVPNSARPDAVKPLLAVPIVSWSESAAGGVVTRVRRGGGVRLYMERPWYSSGAGELLGAVLRPAKYAPLSADWKTLRQFVSEWGMDPIWRATETAPLVKADFANSVADDADLTLAELTGLDVDVVGFEAQYDTTRNLWFCDIALHAPRQYFPFVRLALARYQPISVDDAHLSRVVPSDFIQVLPHRRVAYDTTQVGVTGEVGIRVNGPAYLHREREILASPLVMARVERRRFDTGDEAGWEVVATHPIPVVQRDPDDTVWQGKLRLPSPAPSPLRIVVLEAEVYAADPHASRAVESRLREELLPVIDQGPIAQLFKRDSLDYRIAFADAIELP